MNRSRLLPWGMALLPLALCQAVSAAGAMVTPSAASGVGEVTLSIGQAVLVRAAGDRLPVTRGAAIRPGDQIDTTSGGHVHVRFVDGAMVSVRPDSRLIVEDYRYTPQAVADSAVKFRLERGTARAISGAAAEGAKERFRLNTPLVAIGVRGTDFVVSSRPEQTVASVNQGAIVMAPFSDTCLPGSLGPCATPFAQLLSADMGSVMAEFRDGLARPEIRSVYGQVGHVASVDTAKSGLAGKPEAAPAKTAPSPVGGGTVVASAGPSAGTETVKLTDAGGPIAMSVASVGVDDASVSSALTEGLLSQVVATNTPPASLAWGRWGTNVSASDFAQPYSAAREGRQVTIGNSWHVLFRSPEGGPVLNQTGQFDFSLRQSHAQLNTATGVAPATVTGGRLSVDFGQRQFSTELNVQSAATGAQSLVASGQIKNNGMFSVAAGAGGKVSGAAAFDGKSVGYLFEKAVSSGVLSGITLWSR